MNPTRRVIALGTAAAGLLLASAGAAGAHVTASPSETPAGGYAVLDFALSHGCEGSPTTAIAIQVPEGVTSVAPTVVPGWTIDIANETLATPIDDGHGGQVTERTASVTYTAVDEPLADGLRQVFPVSMKMPDDAGASLAFPVVQSCVEGESAWITVPEEGEAEPDHPAPVVDLVASTGGDGHGHGGEDADVANGETDATADEAASNAAGEDSDDNSNGLAVTALVVGGVGVGAGALALARTRR